MKASVDIPGELLIIALAEINKKKNICKVLPTARFMILGRPMGLDHWTYSGLVCGLETGKNTGFGVTHCRNCLKESEP